MVIRPEIDALPSYKPGIKPDEELRRYGIADVIKLNSNEGPWPPFPDAIEAIKRAASGLNRYPDQSYRRLTKALSDFYGVEQTQIQVGNGSGSLIRLFAQVVLRPGDEAMVGWPPYPNYLIACGVSGAALHRIPLRDGAIDLRRALAEMTERTRVVFVANPHNPTGSIVPRDELEWYFEQVPDTIATVLDEAYFEFVTEPGYPDGRAFLKSGKPLIALRTFSKVYGLAGLRVGFGFATPEIATAMSKARETFIISALAVEAAIASLPRQDLVRERVQNIAAGRAAMAAICDELGIEHTPSQGNFLFMNLRRNTSGVFIGLLKRGILVRSGEVHQAPGWIRVTVGLPEENEKFVRALRDVLDEVPEAAALLAESGPVTTGSH